MLDIIIPENELYDEKNGEFIYIKEQKICLEHSLISLSKWESKYEKPFLSSDKSAAEILDYIRFMTLTQNVKPEVYLTLSKANLDAIEKYINAPMSATTVPPSNKRNPVKETITAELIYYWMIALNIPFECQKWHLNRLLKLVEVCSYKNEPPKKMTRNEILQRNRQLNAARRAKYHTKG